MQTNFQVRSDRFDQKPARSHDGPKLPAASHPIDEAASVELIKGFTSGVVTDCSKLRVRKEPSTDAEVLLVINVLSEVTVDMDASTVQFYKVRTDAGVEGFCMKKYIAIKR